MPENKTVKTIKMIYREDFEQNTSEMIANGYTMISAGYTEAASGARHGCWWAVLMKDSKGGSQ